MILSHFHMIIHSHERRKANTMQSAVNQPCKRVVVETRELPLQSKLADVLLVWEIRSTIALKHWEIFQFNLSIKHDV